MDRTAHVAKSQHQNEKAGLSNSTLFFSSCPKKTPVYGSFFIHTLIIIRYQLSLLQMRNSQKPRLTNLHAALRQNLKLSGK